MMVHFERAGKPFSMLLDLVKVAESHTRVNLAIAFATVLRNFGVDEKVRASNRIRKGPTYDMSHADTWHHGQQCIQ
jgi:hypothetical protein